jgi:predicted nucleic acid-binding protein
MERKAAETLFASMKQIELSQKIAEIAVEERKKQGLKLPDAVILASADAAGCILVTRNAKDFDKSDPRVRFPYSL